MTRRRALLAAGAAALAPMAQAAFAQQAAPNRVVRRGRLKQSVARWCYRQIPLPDLCRAVADMGLTAIDLLAADEWPLLKEYGLVCSMGWHTGGDIPDGLNDPANHDTIVNGLLQALPRAADHGVPNLIAFFGNRRGRADAEASRNCVAGLNRVKAAAERHGVTICVELLNSKVDHADYQGDRTAFGLEIV